jgi:hypothetical protein
MDAKRRRHVQDQRCRCRYQAERGTVVWKMQMAPVLWCILSRIGGRSTRHTVTVSCAVTISPAVRGNGNTR